MFETKVKEKKQEEALAGQVKGKVRKEYVVQRKRKNKGKNVRSNINGNNIKNT